MKTNGTGTETRKMNKCHQQLEHRRKYRQQTIMGWGWGGGGCPQKVCPQNQPYSGKYTSYVTPYESNIRLMFIDNRNTHLQSYCVGMLASDISMLLLTSELADIKQNIAKMCLCKS